MNGFLKEVIHQLKNLPGRGYELVTSSDQFLTWAEKVRLAEKGLGKVGTPENGYYRVTKGRLYDIVAEAAAEMKQPMVAVYVHSSDTRIESKSDKLPGKVPNEPLTFEQLEEGLIALNAYRPSSVHKEIDLIDDGKNASCYKGTRSISFEIGSIEFESDEELKWTTGHEFEHFGEHKIADQILTGTKQVMDWTLDLAIETCKWALLPLLTDHVIRTTSARGTQHVIDEGFKGFLDVSFKQEASFWWNQAASLFDTITNYIHPTLGYINNEVDVKTGIYAGITIGVGLLALALERQHYNEFRADKAGNLVSKETAASFFKRDIEEHAQQRLEFDKTMHPSDRSYFSIRRKIEDTFGSLCHPSDQRRIKKILGGEEELAQKER